MSSAQPTLPMFDQKDPEHHLRLRDTRVSLHLEASCPRWRTLSAFVLVITICGILGLNRQGVPDISVKHSNAGHVSFSSDHQPLIKAANTQTCLKGVTWIADPEHPPVEIRPGEWQVAKTFSMPLDANELAFLATEPLTSGSIHFITYDQEGADAKIEVKASYNDEKSIARAEVCLASADQNTKHAFTIIVTPQAPWSQPPFPERPVVWEVKISIPHGTTLRALKTYLWSFAHAFEVESLDFQALDVFTINAPIHLNSIRTESLIARTSNGPITGDIQASNATLLTSNGLISGTFNISSSLKASTTNADVVAAFTLHDRQGSDSRVSALLETTSGAVGANIRLTADNAASGYRGRFAVDAVTKNGPVTLDVLDAPVESSVFIRGTSDNGPIQVHLPPTYEGAVAAMAVLGNVTVNIRDVEDPKGEGRNRSMDAYEEQGLLLGAVYWGPREKDGSEVKVNTALGPVEITL